MDGPRRPASAVARTAFLVGAALGAPGCVGWGSASLPPPLTDAERRTLECSRLPLTVGVAPYEWPAYSDRLLDGLQGTGLFERVAFLGDLERPPDLIASVDRRIHGSATIPLWTLLTFGIVPSSVDEDWGWSFWLSAPGNCAELRHVEYVHTGPTTLGWLALLDVAAADRTVVPFSPKGSRRMYDRLALAVLERADDLRAVRRPE